MIKTILIITRYFNNIIIYFLFMVSAMPPPNPKENIIYFSSDWRMSACSYFKGCIDCLASKQKTDKSFSVAIIMLPTFFIFINKLNKIKTLIFFTTARERNVYRQQTVAGSK